MIKELMCKWFRVEPFPCQSCETLKLQLSIANDEKRQLLNSIISSTKQHEIESPQLDYEKLKPKMMTWNIRRQMLEAEDKKAAQIIAEQKKHAAAIKDLEKEVGIEKEVENVET